MSFLDSFVEERDFLFLRSGVSLGGHLSFSSRWAWGEVDLCVRTQLARRWDVMAIGRYYRFRSIPPFQPPMACDKIIPLFAIPIAPPLFRSLHLRIGVIDR